MTETKLISYIITDFISKSEMRMAEISWQEIINNVKYQNSDLDDLPEKSTYLVKQVLTDPTKFITYSFQIFIIY